MHSYLHKNFILAKSGCYREDDEDTTALDTTTPSIEVQGPITRS
jgi:hypothetical protein